MSLCKSECSVTIDCKSAEQAHSLLVSVGPEFSFNNIVPLSEEKHNSLLDDLLGKMTKCKNVQPELEALASFYQSAWGCRAVPEYGCLGADSRDPCRLVGGFTSTSDSAIGTKGDWEPIPLAVLSALSRKFPASTITVDVSLLYACEDAPSLRYVIRGGEVVGRFRRNQGESDQTPVRECAA